MYIFALVSVVARIFCSSLFRRSTIAGAVPAGFDVVSWQGLFAPAGTPPAIVDRINTELQKVLATTETKAKMYTLGLEYAPNTPKQFADYQVAEMAKWVKIVKAGNVKID